MKVGRRSVSDEDKRNAGRKAILIVCRHRIIMCRQRLHVNRSVERWKTKHINFPLYLYRFLDSWSNTTFTRNKAIQDHVAHIRKNYEREIIEFNNKRLAAKKSDSKTANGFSVIVLDWNTEAKTKSCINSIRTCCPDSEIILVENGKHFDCPEANKIIKLEMNLGFAAGVNRGVMEAIHEYLLIVNSDTIVESGLIEKLQKALTENPDIGVVGPYSNYAKLPQGNYCKDHPDTRENKDLEMVSGFCMMMRKELFNKVGGFDSRLSTFEDDDFCFKIRFLGYKCRAVGGTWLYHEGHESFKSNKQDVFAVMDENKKIRTIIFGINKNTLALIRGED